MNANVTAMILSVARAKGVSLHDRGQVSILYSKAKKMEEDD